MEAPEQLLLPLSSDRAAFPIAVNGLSADLAAATALGVLKVDQYDARIGAGIRYVDSIVGQITAVAGTYDLGYLTVDQMSVRGAAGGDNDAIYDLASLLTNAVTSRFIVLRDINDLEQGRWRYGDVLTMLYMYLRLPAGKHDILPLQI